MAIILKAGSEYASYRMTESIGFHNFSRISNKMVVEADTQISANGSDQTGLVHFRFGDSPVLYTAASDNVITQWRFNMS